MSSRAPAVWLQTTTLAVAAVLVAALAAGAVPAQGPPTSGSVPRDSAGLAGPLAGDRSSIRAAIERHLGRPYVWGSAGLKSFDCSGFVWRVMQENGIFIKRTTARKYFMSMPKVSEEERWEFGNIVFFSNLKHCGIVDTREGFYHAAVTAGTHRSQFDPLWRRRLTGIRAMPGLKKGAAAGRTAN